MKTIKPIIAFSLIIAAVFAFARPAAAMEKVATLVRVEGSFEILQPNETDWRQGQKLDPIYMETKIRTGRDSEGTILWDQGHAVTVEENSLLVISHTIRRGGVEQTQLDLEKGKLITVAKKLEGEDSAFEVKTPYSTCGVRGTTFAVAADSREAKFEVLAGYIDVERDGDVQRVDTQQQASVSSKGSIKPEKMSDYDRRWLLYYADEATIASDYVGGINTVYGERSHEVAEDHADQYNQSVIISHPWHDDFY